MKTKVDEIYSELKGRLRCGVLVFTDNPAQNFQILDKNVQTVNIAKCGLEDIEKEYPGASTYLTYLLQSEKHVPFGLCEEFKMWYSLKGRQARCKQNQGPTQVHCNGLPRNCTVLSKKMAE